MKRVFIAVPIVSETAFQVVNTWTKDRQLNINRLKWTNPGTWHVTLYFVGDTPESEIDLLRQLIDESFGSVHGFNTRLNGVGVFPNQHNPKVLWLGLESLQPLMLAYQQLGDLLRRNGFPFDTKPLKPHVTLARIKSLENHSSLDVLMSENQQFNFGTVAINRVVLFESILTPEGPVYKPLFVKWFN
jgi:2'-5' RNA ligase